VGWYVGYMVDGRGIYRVLLGKTEEKRETTWKTQAWMGV